MSNKADKTAEKIYHIIFNDRHYDVVKSMKDSQLKRFTPRHIQDAANEMVEEILQIFDEEKNAIANRYREKMGLPKKEMENVRYNLPQGFSNKEYATIKRHTARAMNNRYATPSKTKGDN